MKTGTYTIGYRLPDDRAVKAKVALEGSGSSTIQPAIYKSVTLSRAPEAAPPENLQSEARISEILPSKTLPHKAEPSLATLPTPFDTAEADDDFFADAFEGMLDITPQTTVHGFRAGTRIQTTRGMVNVEALKNADELLTDADTMRRVTLVEQRAGHSDGHGGLAIRIAADALADRVPSKDLWVAPKQALLIDGVRVAADELVNGVSIVEMRLSDPIAFYHIALATPDVLLAEDAPVESFAEPELPRGSAPLRDALRRRIARRAGVSDKPDPGLGALEGFLEDCRPDRIAGWAQNKGKGATKVRLAVLLDGLVIAEIMADALRDDLITAGIGDGRHAFDFRPVPPIPPAKLAMVKVVRALDGVELQRFALVSP